MKFLFDLLPVILFFGVFKLAEGNPGAAQDLVSHYLSNFMSGGPVSATLVPILLATAVAIVASVAQIVYLLARRRKVDAMLWISLTIIVVLGGATIYFQNDTFVKWKPTILYWAFAVTLLVSQVLLKKNLIRTMMEKQMVLPDAIWGRLSLSWILFFSIMGLLNLYVAFHYTTDVWVNFKLFGSMGLMFVFIIVQSLFLSKYMKDEP
ncbi:intracellular septation protein [Herbaspirillum sp. Sphag1AN]|uniref:septation protein A n=1 Tax=unclassified Herbaspirillum TaxID=2624150 RepID=UPI00161F8E15|nr:MULTISPECIES: septation protein A [unclassified Herbaspirillum]MBB3212135.1 intracellular septation protein [Herbaspirillum sp. Sphag1AN]MBB3244031.1 intracellular septation protein [Herbaspirillum sp. Sphag64]